MSYGLRVWDAGGKLRLDITDRFPKIFTSFYVTMASFETRTLSAPGFSPGDFLIDSDFSVFSVGVDTITIRNYLNDNRSGSVFVYKG